MKIQCPNCKTGLKISETKKPADGTKVTCPKCKKGFVFKEQFAQKNDSGKKSPVEKKNRQAENAPSKNEPLKEKQAQEQPEENEAPLFTKCPQCAYPIVDDLKACPNCGLTLKKEKFSLRKSIDKTKSEFNVEKVKKGIFAYLYKNVFKSAKTYAILIALILFVSIFGGRIPIISTLFQEDREIMYEGGYGKSIYPGLRGRDYELDAIVFILKIANTGQETINGIEVDIADIPYRFQQVFYTCQNLTSVNTRESDPTLSIICPGNKEVRAWKYKGTTLWRGISDEMAALYVDDFVKEYELYPNSVVFRDLCPNPDTETNFDRTWHIENLDPGAFIQIGIVTYANKDDMEWDAFSKIKVAVKADAEIVKADPQSSAFVRLFKSILD